MGENADNQAGSPGSEGGGGPEQLGAGNPPGGGDNGNQGIAGRSPESDVEAPPAEKKRRGRPPGSGSKAGQSPASAPIAPASAGKAKKDLGVAGKVRNDRAKLRQNIAAIHGAVAVLTNTPVFALTDPEADALTESLAAVLDFHGLDITGGNGSVHLTLIITAFMIYRQRVPALLSKGRKSPAPRVVAPTTVEEALTPRPANGGLDLSGATPLN